MDQKTDPRATANPSRAHEVAVERLIELASEPKGSAPNAPKGSAGSTSRPTGPGTPPKDNRLVQMTESPMWKTLSQFKGLLPYASRLMPLLELAGRAAQATSPAASNELRQGLVELQTSQSDLQLAVRDQTKQLRRFEDQVTRLTDSAEKIARDQSELAENVRSIRSLVRGAAIFLGLLLIALLGMAGYLVYLLSLRHG